MCAFNLDNPYNFTDEDIANVYSNRVVIKAHLELIETMRNRFIGHVVSNDTNSYF